MKCECFVAHISLLFSLLYPCNFSSVISPTLRKRANDIPDLNITPSPGRDDGIGNVDVLPPHIVTNQSPQNIDEKAISTKKRKRVEVLNEERKRQRTSSQKKRWATKKYEYENRYNLGKSAEEIAAIEDAEMTRRAKAQSYKKAYSRNAWSRIKSGQPTAADLKLKECNRQRKAALKAQQKRWYYANTEKARLKQRKYRLERSNARKQQASTAPST